MSTIEVNLPIYIEVNVGLDLHEIREHGHDEEESPF